jgi:hypothetical protein
MASQNMAQEPHGKGDGAVDLPLAVIDGNREHRNLLEDQMNMLLYRVRLLGLLYGQ